MEKEVAEIKKVIEALPEQDRTLYSKFHVGEEHPIYEALEEIEKQRVLL